MESTQDENNPELRAQKLLDLERAKSRFFANISHEFRTPLTLILGPVDQLLACHSDADTRDQLELIKRNGNRLLLLIDQLLELSKLENEAVDLVAYPTHMGKFCQHIVDVFMPLAEAKKVTLTYEEIGEQRSALIDRNMVEKVLFNLLSNAFKFTPSGKSIELILSEHTDHFGIVVRDHGIGVPKEDLSHLFDRFYQGKDGQRVRGTGIGLALTKEYVELHHGEISVESTVGKGTSFHIKMPYEQPDWDLTKNDPEYKIARVEFDEESYSDRIPNPELDLEEPQAKPILLLVEDDDELRRFTRSMLEKDYTLVEAINGEEGIELANSYLPDLIITDVMMPKKSGTELCSEVKSNRLTAHIPIIMLTAKSAEEDKITGLEVGADDYLLKPFNATEVQLKVRNTLRLRDTIIANFTSGGKPSSEDVFVQEFFDAIQSRYEEPELGVNDLADAMGVSRSQLHRKIAGVTGLSAARWLRQIRLAKAKEFLLDPDLNVSEVCYSVGFNNPSYFAKCFKEEFGILPVDFQSSL